MTVDFSMRLTALPLIRSSAWFGDNLSRILQKRNGLLLAKRSTRQPNDTTA